jgi:hypothetical protein
LDIKESWNWLYERTCWCQNARLFGHPLSLFFDSGCPISICKARPC